MTPIDFYVQVGDRQEIVRKLCARALGAQANLVVWCPDQPSCQKLSRVLWSVPATGFLPHCFAGDPLAWLEEHGGRRAQHYRGRP